MKPGWKSVSTLFLEAFKAQMTDKDLLLSSILSLLAGVHPAAVEKEREKEPSPACTIQLNTIPCQLCLACVYNLSCNQRLLNRNHPRILFWGGKDGKIKAQWPRTRWFRPEYIQSKKKHTKNERHQDTLGGKINWKPDNPQLYNTWLNPGTSQS